MRIREHIIISAVTSGTAYLVTKSEPLAASMLLSGIFIDLDHFVDYFIHERRIRIDVRDFFMKCEQNLMDKFIAPLHSYELIVILAAVYYFFNNTILLGIIIGMTIHLCADIISNNVFYFSYSLSSRIYKGFKSKDLFKFDKINGKS